MTASASHVTVTFERQSVIKISHVKQLLSLQICRCCNTRIRLVLQRSSNLCTQSFIRFDCLHLPLPATVLDAQKIAESMHLFVVCLSSCAWACWSSHWQLIHGAGLSIHDRLRLTSQHQRPDNARTSRKESTNYIALACGLFHLQHNQA